MKARKYKPLKVFRSSVEKVYGWKVKDGYRPGNPMLMGLLEIWFLLPEKGKGSIEVDTLSPEGIMAAKGLKKKQWRGWIA